MNKLTVIFLLTLVIAASSLSACNTISGVGEDLQTGGRVLQNAAE